ncbi:MAG TPA: serine/threonine-protein kinase [Gaiellaceae bacterium]|nr:serine/threonine-protein kinase [Gaiellaceae bacterium]
MAVDAGILPERYQGVTRIARGGMGEVYRATDTLLGRPVAVKLLSARYAANSEIHKRFTREGLAAARLSSDPDIVTIYDVGESNGRPFIVMEYIEGGSLSDEIRRSGAQPPQRALAWLETVADALDYAHARGVVHRDVKPANLLLDDDDAIHVADFGIASAAGLDSLTQTGTILGTSGYLAPEQAQGRAAGPEADRYALGVVAFEFLTGARPFENDSPTAEAAAHVNSPVPSISSRGRGIPKEADDVFRRALAKDPSKRFRSCAEFVAALRDAYSSSAGETEVTAPAPPGRRARSQRRLPLLLGLLALVLAGGAVAGALIAGGGSGGGATPPITVTERGTTVRETITAQPLPTSTRAPVTTSSPGGVSLADAGYARLEAGDAAGALPLLEQAAQKLQGTRSTSEAYNDYNLAVALTETQGCSTRVLQLLDTSQSIQGHRKEIDRLRKSCKHHGHGSGKG